MPVEESVIYPTFVRSIPRKKPPQRPAGIRKTSEEERARWKRDGFRFAPYQYGGQYMMVPKGAEQSVRPLALEARTVNTNGRESHLGLPEEYTWNCVSAKPWRTPRVQEDCRLSLLGNTFSGPVVSWLLGQRLAELGYLEVAPEF